jgi:hypothetical protein
MHPFIRRLIEKSLDREGLFPARLADTEEVMALIRALRPVTVPAGLVRLGPPRDGGYLVPDDLEGLQTCFSPGVEQQSGFERDCAERGMQVHLADLSVAGPAEAHERFHFTRKHIGVLTTEDSMTLDDWVKRSCGDTQGDLLLQIDIEGSEYEVFLGASDALMKRFRIIVAEFHSMDQLWNAPFFNLASRAFSKILQTHGCVHLHPNNHSGSITREGVTIPEVMEMTFLRHDRIKGSEFVESLPHPLDRSNRDHADLVLSRHWLGGAG